MSTDVVGARTSRVVGALGVAAFAVLGTFLLTRWDGVDLEFPEPALPHPHGPTLPLPPPGDVLPAALGDGWPVFVVRHEDGTTDVLSAVSPHRGLGVGEAVVWCPSSGWFEELQHGAAFSEWGSWVAGPAPTGLETYPWRPEGTDRIRIDGPGRAMPRGVGHGSEPTGPRCTDVADREFVAHVRGERPLPTPKALVASPAERWRPAEAAVVLDRGVLTLCSPGELVGQRCPGDAPRFRPPQPAGAVDPFVIVGAMLIWASEDELRAPILLAETAK